MRRHENKTLMVAILAVAFLGASSGFAGEETSSQPCLKGRNAPHSEAWLNNQVRRQILGLPFYTVFDNLEYRLTGDHVELLGQVVNPALKADADAAVKQIKGVASVTDHIEVLPVSMFDNQIRFAMLRAIYWNPDLSMYAMGTHPSIHIIVKNGHVTLVGMVNNKMDKQLAYMQANSVPNVFSVTNELRIASGRKG